VFTFDKRPGYTTCKGCGAKPYLTPSGQLGVFPREGWETRRLRQGAEEADLSIDGRVGCEGMWSRGRSSGLR